ncbi:MAG: glycosyltransferase [Flavobacteriaceae bacterium]
MKVLHITTSLKGGAGIAALRLHKGLCKEGIASAYLSINRTINYQNKDVEDSFFTYKKPSVFLRLLQKIKRLLKPSLSQKWEGQLAKIKPHLSYEIISFPFSSFALEKHPLVQEADIINLHWVGGILDYPSFFKNVNKPIVWTLHDMNPFMGIFHYETDVKKNPKAKLIDEKMKEIKKKAIGFIKKGAIVSPSQWLLNLEKESEFFSHFKIHSCIANSLLIEDGNITKENARKELALDPNENVILFTAASIDNPRKGMELLRKALDEVSVPLTLLILGKGSLSSANNRVKVIPLGFLTSEKEIFKCYRAADVFVLPSREDNLPNTMLESLAQGTPVISFANGGMKEVIVEGKYGMIVHEQTPTALRFALETFFKNKENYKSNDIKKFASENFSHVRQAKAYKTIYESLL